ncbi:unnamed protein product [Calicophoron daubneyi]|uniref:Uncharacterized protein n=1 Tax=Calicophoron daubneyi TaxID=300641 RepID=A0AAV2TS09_CALDB
MPNSLHRSLAETTAFFKLVPFHRCSISDTDHNRIQSSMSLFPYYCPSSGFCKFWHSNRDYLDSGYPLIAAVCSVSTFSLLLQQFSFSDSDSSTFCSLVINSVDIHNSSGERSLFLRWFPGVALQKETIFFMY